MPICEICWTEFSVLSGTLCVCCGDTLDAPTITGPSSRGLCRTCRMATPAFQRAVAYGPYEERMKAAIHALKYDRLHGLARGLGRMLATAIAQLADEAPGELLVVPVPLHRSKFSTAASIRPARWPSMRWLRSAKPIPTGGSRWPRRR